MTSFDEQDNRRALIIARYAIYFDLSIAEAPVFKGWTILVPNPPIMTNQI
jgi:hypothetical protein